MYQVSQPAAQIATVCSTKAEFEGLFRGMDAQRGEGIRAAGVGLGRGRDETEG